ncbi:MAG: hypothetical protein AAB267_07390, partial [Candidatus Desantisbacteria bacterium]
LISAKYGNAGYHMLQILTLQEDYPHEVLEKAIERATVYGAFGCGVIKNICRQGEKTRIPEAKEIALSEKTPLARESVEERSLSYYSQLEG